MIAFFLVALLICVALAIVAQPLLGGARYERDHDRDHAIDEAEMRKRSALLAIVDIEEEKEIGKLSAVDFEALRTQYERQALDALRELDVLSAGGTTPEDDLEAEIAAMREQMTCPHCGALRAQMSSSGAAGSSTCTRCGR